MQPLHLVVRDKVRARVRELVSNADYDFTKALGKDFVHFFLIFTHSCNLKCPYCYQGDSLRRNPGLMTEKIVDDSMKYISRNFSHKRVTITLFGGEALTNFDLVKYTITKYPMFRYIITTNGKFLLENPDAVAWLSKQHGVALSFSITALKSTYGADFIQKTPPVLDLIRKIGTDVHYVIDNPDDPNIIEDIRFLKDYPFGMLRISNAREMNFTDVQRDKLITLWKKLIDVLYATKAKNPIFLDKFLTGKSNVTRSCTGEEMTSDCAVFCGAGIYYFAVDIDGKIYPCDYFIQFPEMALGDIYKGILHKDGVFKDNPNWYREIYKHCDDCPLEDIRLCANAPCCGENYRVHKDLFKICKSTCTVRIVDYEAIKYLIEKYGKRAV